MSRTMNARPSPGTAASMAVAFLALFISLAGIGSAAKPAPPVPAGTVSFFNLAACPSGWTELTAAQGRYLVGLPSGGTLGGTTGTALTNGEDRPVGQHDHGVTDPGHVHRPVQSPDWGDPDSELGGGTPRIQVRFDSGLTLTTPVPDPLTKSSFTGVTVDNAGSVPGTNAPYMQLLVCQKS
jgi:hypothetical protein